MATYLTTGIVIGRVNFGEADRVVRFLTPDHGKLSAVAKGVRRVKSKAGGHLELLGEVKLMLATGRNLDVVTSARLSWYPHQLVTDYQRLDLAFTFARAVDRLTEPGSPQPKLYLLLAEALRVLDADAGGPLPELWFRLRLLEILGYRPELGRCIVCGSTTDTEYAFSPERGGITCRSDADPGAQPMSHTAIKFWRLLSDYPYSTISQIAGAEALAAGTLPLCLAFYAHHLDR